MRYKGIKRKAWEAVKESVRRREKHCYTCNANNYWSWHPDFIHLQCSRCNGAGQGMLIEYRQHLVKDYGEERVMEFDTNYRKINPIKNWQTIIDLFDSL